MLSGGCIGSKKRSSRLALVSNIEKKVGWLMELMIKAKFYANLDDPGILQMMTFLFFM
jgi:hypothetical protein